MMKAEQGSSDAERHVIGKFNQILNFIFSPAPDVLSIPKDGPCVSVRRSRSSTYAGILHDTQRPYRPRPRPRGQDVKLLPKTTNPVFRLQPLDIFQTGGAQSISVEL